MALIRTGICVECNEKIDNDGHYFCKDCFRLLKDNKRINLCPDCKTWTYTAGHCLCDTAFYQCNKCSRWCTEDDKCICNFDDKERVYKQKATYSPPEKIFRKKLEDVVDHNKYIIEGQASLRQMVEKALKKKCWSQELNRDIDFRILSKENYELVLLIEYNDTTHDNPERKERDRKVNYICKEAGLTLLTIKRDDNMTLDYLRGKLEDYLK